MKRFQRLLKETWWLWTIFVLTAILLITFVNPIFIVILPMMIIIFIYFAFVRYDDDGNFNGS